MSSGVVLASEDHYFLCVCVWGGSDGGQHSVLLSPSHKSDANKFSGLDVDSVSLNEVEREVSHIVFLISRFGNFEYLAESWWKDCRVSCGCQSVF